VELSLVGGAITVNNNLEKYEFVNGKDDIPYIMETNKCLKHLETTNQIISTKTQKPPICSSPP